MTYLRIKNKSGNITTINTYILTHRRFKEEEKEQLYEEPLKIIKAAYKYGTIILMGDFNAQTGKETYYRDMAKILSEKKERL